MLSMAHNLVPQGAAGLAQGPAAPPPRSPTRDMRRNPRGSHWVWVSSRLAAAKPTAFPPGIWSEVKFSVQTCFYIQPHPAHSRRFVTQGAGCEWSGQRAPGWAHSTPDSSQPSTVTGFFSPLFLYLITLRFFHGVRNTLISFWDDISSAENAVRVPVVLLRGGEFIWMLLIPL